MFVLCYRNYALRRIRDSFKENKNLNGEASVESLMNEARKNLEMIKRQVKFKVVFEKLFLWKFIVCIVFIDELQVIIGSLYDTEKLVIEHEKTTSKSINQILNEREEKFWKM